MLALDLARPEAPAHQKADLQIPLCFVQQVVATESTVVVEFDKHWPNTGLARLGQDHRGIRSFLVQKRKDVPGEEWKALCDRVLQAKGKWASVELSGMSFIIFSKSAGPRPVFTYPPATLEILPQN